MDSQQKTDIQAMEDKMAAYVDKLTGKSSGLVKTASPSASMSNNSYKQYRSSFLTLSDMQIPNDYREIFKWCRYFFKFNPLVGSAVRALATFPVTDWILNDTEAADEKDADTEQEDTEEASDTFTFYENMLNDMGLYKHMNEIGYDYFLYGNCVIFAEPGIKVIVRRNKETGELYDKKEVVWKSVQRLDVTRLRIESDPKTNEKIYYYDIPPELKRVIQTQKPKEKYDKIPEVFKKAVQNKGLIKLKSQYVHHLQMPSESGDNGLWATPPVLHAMKLILYSNILRQAQEAIAYEHIIPRRIYYFQETAEFSPGMEFADVSNDFAIELKKQLDDPNYQVISPVPIQQLQHGGQGKALMLVPELEQLDSTILAAMGCPREFVFGGVSYSGSTTSLRILENHFITYRTGLLDYINDFLIKGLAKIRGEWEAIDDDDKLVKVSLSDLKMQDDIQQKQLMITLNQAGKLPDEVLYEKALGLDSTKTIKQLQAERKRKLQEQFDLQIEQVKMQQEMQQVMAEMGQATPPAPVNGPMVTEPAPGALDEQPQEDLSVTDEQPAASDGEKQPQDQPQEQQQGPQPGMENREALKLAQQMQGMNESQMANLIHKMPQETARRVMMYYNHLKTDSQESETDMRPYPTQKPPRRQVGGV